MGDTGTGGPRTYCEAFQRTAATNPDANRIEFYPFDVGAQHLGASAFSVYNTLSAGQLGYVLTNAGAKVVVCEAPYVDRIPQSSVPIEHIVCPDGAPDGTVDAEELIGMESPDFDFESSWRAVQPDDVLTLIYMSGTTGPPEGVEMTHANLLFEVAAFTEMLPVQWEDRIPLTRTSSRGSRRGLPTEMRSCPVSNSSSGSGSCRRTENRAVTS
jgi:acyl-CoA synthetase (AMP-forming)/AMP-acid ligase II